MEAFLIDEWLRSEPEQGDAIPIADEASVSLARQKAREIGAAQKMGALCIGRLATIASELAQNQLKYARRGQILVKAIRRGDVVGVEIVAADEGAGIADPAVALAGKATSAASLGAGLAAVREHTTEVDFDVRIGEGTCIRARLFDGEVSRRREVGVYGRPYRDEPRSGDHACVHRTGDRLLLGICDGLGHGKAARQAAGVAMRVFADHLSASPRAIMDACHASLGSTRGAVMAILSLAEEPSARSNELELASVGNITVELVKARESRRFAASSFVVGGTQRGWRAHVETNTVDRSETLVMFTDGIASRVSLSEELALLREHPIVIAHSLVSRFAREGDDALVVVAR